MVDGERQKVRRAMISGVRWLATARLLAQTSNWVITLIVIRLLTPTDYGLQAMATVIYMLLFLISQGGVARAVARHTRLEKNELGNFLGFNLVLNLSLMAIVWFAAPYVAIYYKEEAVTPLLRVLALGFVISVFKTIPTGLVWQQLDYRNHALASLIGTVTGSLVTLTLAILGYGVWALILGMLATPVTTAIYLQMRKRWLVMPRLGMTGIRTLVRYGYTISLSFFVWMFAWRLGILLGGNQLSAAELGFYAVAVQLCALPLGKIVPLANEILYPAYARLQEDSAAISGYFEKALASLCFLLFPVFLGLAAIAYWIVPVVFGPRWEGIEQIMIIVALAMPFRVVLAMCNPMLEATGNAMTSLTTGVFAVVFIAISMVVGLQWGIIGLAYATLVATPVVMVVVVMRTRESSGLSFGSFVNSLGPSLAISAVMAIIVYQIGAKAAASLPDAAVVGLQIVSGALVYAVLALIFTRGLLLSTISIIRTSLKVKRRVSQ